MSKLTELTKKINTHLDRLQFAFLLAEFAFPSSLGVCIGLQAAFEFIDLLPPVVKLLPHVAQLLSKSGFKLFGAFVKVHLDLAQRFQPCDEIIMEHAKVRKRFGFGLTTLFLRR